MYNSKDLTSKLKSLREKHGMSLADLAEATGKDRAQINKIEAGLTMPSIDTLNALLAPFGHHLDIVSDEEKDAKFITAEDMIRSIAKFANISVTIDK